MALKKDLLFKVTCSKCKLTRQLNYKAYWYVSKHNGKFLVDVYIPSLNLIIEADGDYWHSLDRVIKKDKAENAYLKKCGYNFLRLSEMEINNTDFGERITVN